MPKKLNGAGGMQEYVPAGNGDASGEYADGEGGNRHFTSFKKPDGSLSDAVKEQRSHAIKEYNERFGVNAYKDKYGEVWKQTSETSVYPDGTRVFALEGENGTQWFSKDEINEMERIGTYGQYLKRESAPTVELRKDNELYKIITQSPDSKYKTIMKYIKDNYVGQEFVFSDGVKATVDNTDAKELTHKADSRKIAEIAALNDLVKNAIPENEVFTEHKKFDKFKYYSVKTRIEGKDKDLWLNIGLSKFGDGYHIYDIVPKNK